jgi:hypothetical protein
VGETTKEYLSSKYSSLSPGVLGLTSPYLLPLPNQDMWGLEVALGESPNLVPVVFILIAQVIPWFPAETALDTSYSILFYLFIYSCGTGV